MDKLTEKKGKLARIIGGLNARNPVERKIMTKIGEMMSSKDMDELNSRMGALVVDVIEAKRTDLVNEIIAILADHAPEPATFEERVTDEPTAYTKEFAMEERVIDGTGRPIAATFRRRRPGMIEEIIVEGLGEGEVDGYIFSIEGVRRAIPGEVIRNRNRVTITYAINGVRQLMSIQSIRPRINIGRRLVIAG